MHNHSSRVGIRICALLFVFVFFNSCNGHDKTMESADESKLIPVTPPENSPPVTSQQESNPPAGDPQFVVEKDTISMQGPQSITRNVLQDKKGNIWLATWEGIICYDGKLFTNFTLKEGLIRFHVFSILEDKNGNIWFGTIGGGAYRYNPSAALKASGNSLTAEQTGFTLFTTKEGLAGNVVLCMLEDKAGNIWFGTHGEGVSRFNGYTFTNFTTQDGLSSNFVNSMAQDKTGKLWFGTRGGVSCCYDPTGLRSLGGRSFTNFTITKDTYFHDVRSIIEDRTGNIWIGSDEGLFRYDPASGELTNFIKNFPGNIIFQDKAGNLWFTEGKVSGPGMTLSRFDGKSFSKIMANDNQIFGITEDQTGNIWFGTVRGVYRYDGKSFDNFTESAARQK